MRTRAANVGLVMNRRRGDESGSILILTALMLSMLLGFAALTLDGARLYAERADLSAAADAAAKAAALQYRIGAGANLDAVAEGEVARFGLLPESGVVTDVHHPPTTGAYSGDAGYVEVVVSHRLGTFFAGILGFPALEPAARAVAGLASSGNCLYALGTTGNPLDIANSADLSLPGCSGLSNGGLNVTPGASVTARELLLASDCSGGGCPQSGIVPSVPIAPDPLATLDPPRVTGTCSAFTLAKNATATIGPGCYSSLSVSANAELRLQPGEYHLTGPLDFAANAEVTGTGVLLHLVGTSSQASISTSTTLTLTAPEAGPYAGILFYQDRGNANPVLSTSSGGAAGPLSLAGLLYFPSATIGFGNESPTVDCALIVARAVELRKNATVRLSPACDGLGGSPLKTTSMSE